MTIRNVHEARELHKELYSQTKESAMKMILERIEAAIRNPYGNHESFSWKMEYRDHKYSDEIIAELKNLGFDVEIEIPAGYLTGHFKIKI